MSQVIASRYAAMANSPEFRELGAPTLTNTAPSPHQREVRNMIVARILEDYAANDTGPIEAMLQDPTVSMGSVQGPGPVKPPNVPRPLPSGVAGGQDAATKAKYHGAQTRADGDDAKINKDVN